MELWAEVDRYLNDLLLPSDPALEAALSESELAGLPPHNVAPNQGKLLMLLAQIHRAKSILEIGTLGGYSTIWLARALPVDGRLVTLEADPLHAEVARKNLVRAGLMNVVQILVGSAADTLATLPGPFDLIFIDADKPNNPTYLQQALRLSRPGTLIIADNIVREGAVIDAASQDPSVQGVRQFLELAASDPRLETTAIQTVGSKGYDGLALAVVKARHQPQ